MNVKETESAATSAEVKEEDKVLEIRERGREIGNRFLGRKERRVRVPFSKPRQKAKFCGGVGG